MAVALGMGLSSRTGFGPRGKNFPCGNVRVFGNRVAGGRKMEAP